MMEMVNINNLCLQIRSKLNQESTGRMTFSYFRPERMGVMWSISAGPLIRIIAVSGPGGGMNDWMC